MSKYANTMIWLLYFNPVWQILNFDSSYYDIRKNASNITVLRRFERI